MHDPSTPKRRGPSWCGIWAAVLFGVLACSSRTDPKAAPPAPSNHEQAPAQVDPTPSKAPSLEADDRDAKAKDIAPGSDVAVAYFAGGCFWGVEYYMERMDGVIDVVSGYMGGRVDEPSYEQVSSGETGHLEAVRVRYDPNVVDYEALARRFFEIHDPTQADGQGPDIGSQYLSAVFVGDNDERATAEKLIQLLKERGYAVVTAIQPVTEFYPAEDYHQDYYTRTRKKPYCHTRVPRFGE